MLFRSAETELVAEDRLEITDESEILATVEMEAGDDVEISKEGDNNEETVVAEIDLVAGGWRGEGGNWTDIIINNSFVKSLVDIAADRKSVVKGKGVKAGVTLIIRLEDMDLNRSSAVAEIFQVSTTEDVERDSVSITLTEASGSAGAFVGEVKTEYGVEAVPADGVLQGLDRCLPGTGREKLPSRPVPHARESPPPVMSSQGESPALIPYKPFEHSG